MARTSLGSAAESLVVGDVAAVDITGQQLTQHCWVRVTNFSGNRMFMGKYSSGQLQYLMYGNTAAKLVCSIGDGTTVDTATSTGSISTGVWQSVGMTKNGNSLIGYLNGTADGSSAGTKSMINTTAPFLMADHGFNDAQLFGGIAECAVWDIGLTAAEMAALAKGFSPLLIRPTSLVAYWPILGNNDPEPDLINNNPADVQGTFTKIEHPRVIMPRAAIYVP